MPQQSEKPESHQSRLDNKRCQLHVQAPWKLDYYAEHIGSASQVHEDVDN